mmetsp:Transcript_11829/g.27077  ORF Transcript_11829/g.27077 Transcript_11829/m.27077 type:complete len:247 (+) Transcript_11829:243-983(+)
MVCWALSLATSPIRFSFSWALSRATSARSCWFSLARLRWASSMRSLSFSLASWAFLPETLNGKSLPARSGFPLLRFGYSLDESNVESSVSASTSSASFVGPTVLVSSASFWPTLPELAQLVLLLLTVPTSVLLLVFFCLSLIGLLLRERLPILLEDLCSSSLALDLERPRERPLFAPILDLGIRRPRSLGARRVSLLTFKVYSPGSSLSSTIARTSSAPSSVLSSTGSRVSFAVPSSRSSLSSSTN